MLACIFGDCREDQRPAACSGVFDWLSETFEEIAEKYKAKNLFLPGVPDLLLFVLKTTVSRIFSQKRCGNMLIILNMSEA